MKTYYLDKLGVEAKYNPYTHRLVTEDGAIYEADEIEDLNQSKISDLMLKTIHQLKIKFGVIPCHKK